MKSLKTLLQESVVQESVDKDIKSFCKHMKIKKYVINPQGEIDVDGDVNIEGETFKELPYKFGTINGDFIISNCKNLISFKNCPNKVMGAFDCRYCLKLKSLEGCPKEVRDRFILLDHKEDFSKEEIIKLCKIEDPYVNVNLDFFETMYF